MAELFRAEEYVGRQLASDETVEIQIGSWVMLAGHQGHSIIVAIDGACRDNGRAGARASIGVCFGDGNMSYNQSEKLPQRDSTSQRAELCAALRAVRLIQTKVADEWQSSITTGNRLERVILKTDSDYLVKSMTDYIFKWMRNDYTTAKNTGVQNADLFRELLHEIYELRDHKNCKILFWKVPRNDNQKADRLANEALDRPTASIWDYRGWNKGVELDKAASERVWRWHLRMAHLPLRLLKHMAPSIDVTEEQIQLEIDKGGECATCVKLGHGPDGIAED